MQYRKVELTCDPALKGYEIDTKGVLYGKYGRVMKPSRNHRGYLIQAFSVNGKMIARSMHQLVAKQFIPNPENKKTVNHKDGNKENNTIDNLEWATHSEQNIHAREVLGVKPAKRCPVIGKDIKSGEEKIFESCADAARYVGATRGSINAVVHGRKKTVKNHTWRKLNGYELKT